MYRGRRSNIKNRTNKQEVPLNQMSDSKEEIISILAKGGMLAIFAALVRALLSKDPLATKIRVFFAGSILGTMVFFALRTINISSFWKEILCICFASFAATIWPVAEKKFIGWFKKSDDVLPGNNA